MSQTSDRLVVASVSDGVPVVEAPRRYDVFVSYNRAEGPAVERIARRLRAEGLDVFFDRWTAAGKPWQEDLAEAIHNTAACAVFIGAEGLGDWARLELAVSQDRAAKDPRFRLFMVLLAGAPSPVDPRLAFLSTRTWVDLRDRASNGFEDLIAAITGIPRHSASPNLESGSCPYRGLEPFDEDHANLFFGREDDVRRLCARLAETRFVAVLGPSGSGKSSVVRAGLIPALRTGAVRYSAGWSIRTMTPGGRPLAALAAQLSHIGVGDAMQNTLARLGDDEQTLDVAAALALADRPAHDRLVIVVDQLEEVFTLCRDEEERAAFLANLSYAATIPGGRTVVVVTLRADFYDRCAPYPELCSVLAGGHMMIGPLDAHGLRRAVEEPAWAAGLTLEPGLVEKILEDVGDRPGTLPLLQHVLLQVWHGRRAGQLTLEAYVESGGVKGALAKHAEAVYEPLPEDQRTLVERIMLRLVQPGDGTEDARRRVEENELLTVADEPAAVEGLVRRLSDERLLTTSWDEASQARTVEITHEALLRGWPRLRRWIERDREALLAHRRLTEASREWEKSGRDEALLYRGTRLAGWRPPSDPSAGFRRRRLTEVVEWRARRYESLNLLERAFLEASDDRWRRERTARRRRIRLAFAGLAVALAAVSAVAVVAVRQSQETARERDLAVSRELAASATAGVSADPQLSVLLASEAVRRSRTAQAVDALRRSFAAFHPFKELIGHGAPLRRVVLSPDARTVLTAGNDGTARLWRAATGTQLAVMSGHAAPVNDAAFSSDGQLVVTASGDGTARVWDAQTGRQLSVLQGHQDSVSRASFSPDDEFVVTAGRDGTARVFEARTGAALTVLHVPHGTVEAAVFDPRGRRVLTAGSDGTARIWSASTAAKLVELRGHKDLIFTAVFSRDGRRVVTASRDGSAIVWRAATGRPVVRMDGHGAPVGSAVFSPDGKQVATGGEDGTARIWETTTGEEVGTLRGHSAPVTDVTYSRDGRLVLTASEDRTARVWNAQNGDEIAVLRGHGDSVVSAALNKNATVIATASRDQTARVWRPGTADAVRVLPHHAEVASATFSPDGLRIATASFDWRARVWDAASGRVVRTLSGHGAPVRSAVFSPDGRALLTASEDGTARVWDLATGRTVLTLQGHRGKVKSAVFSSDGRRILTAGADGSARIWDASTGRTIRVLKGHTEEVEGAVFGLRDRLVATASEDTTARLWSAQSGRSVLRLVGHKDQIEGVAFSGHGDRLVTGSSDDTARIWDTTTGRTIMVLRGHNGDVESADFSTDGRFVATASDDRTARVWDAETGRDVVVFPGNETDLESVAFSRDARFLVTAGEDRTARLYRCELCAPTERLLALARARASRRLTAAERTRYLHDDG